MKTEIKKKWIEALRSGEYKQGRRMLKDNQGKFCCLGVLCDIYAKEKKVDWDSPTTFFASDAELPEKVAMWAGLGKRDPELKDSKGREKSATSWNDSTSKSQHLGFQGIANAIERTL